MRKLAITNQKGGAGKTTLTKHLANAAIEQGVRTLIIDLDPQGSLSQSFPPSEGAEPGLMASALFSPDPVTLKPEVLAEGVGIIRGDKTLSLVNGAAPDVAKMPARHLRELVGEYDLCVIDTPGAIGFNPPMTVAALVAADAVVCPFSVGLYEGKALADLWEYLKAIKAPAYNPRLRLMGLLPSKINTRSRDEMKALEVLRAQFGAVILPGMLAERTAVKKSVMAGRPVWHSTKGAGHLAAAQEWRAVCNFILGNLGGITQ
jgi:chromosome partitioning protein